MCRELYGAERHDEADDFARNLLFDLAHAVGRTDAQRFHRRMGLEAPIEKLAAGPVHFSHTGWALVDIKAESRPSSDDSFYFLYDHPYSFEADAWLEAGRETSIPVCIMNSGYSSGWCEESYGIPLVTYEVLCRARGDEACRFIMGHPERIESHVDRFVQSHGVGAKRRRDVPIPDFFYRKRAEEELRRGRADLEARVAERTRELSETNTRLREEMRQRERAEKKLLSSAKLEALGKLAGGIAHDFNNLMSVVIGHASMLEQKLDDDSFLAQVAQIRLAGEQAAALTQQLLAFSAARVAQQEPLAFDHTVAEVIMNLALNARDAMKDGGVVKIVTASVEVTKETPLESHDVPMGHFSVVEVSDTGVGMDDETLARAFEPFFTTKTAEGGTGLGLPTVSSVVTRSKGHISISTAPSEGTRIRIYLPRLETAEPIAPEARPLTPIPRGQETILVVEDQAGVRQMVVQLLETLGYTVIAAASPTEALRLAEERDSGLSLLLTDVVMPSMSGRELADRLQRKFGALPVLFVSGYADDEVLRYGVAQGTADLLPKPFTPNELAERVRAALDRARR
jgi:signal transduction histidine kinase/ActR/RegA family two-component response regulator